MVTVDYSDAEYTDGGTGLDKEVVFKTLFVDDEPGFNASVLEELNALEEVTDVPETVRVSEVNVEEESDSIVHFFVRTHDLTVGTQPERQGGHSLLVFRGDEYDHYRVAVVAS